MSFIFQIYVLFIKLCILYIETLYIVYLNCISCVFKLYESFGRKLSSEIQSNKLQLNVFKLLYDQILNGHRNNVTSISLTLSNFISFF